MTRMEKCAQANSLAQKADARCDNTNTYALPRDLSFFLYIDTNTPFRSGCCSARNYVTDVATCRCVPVHVVRKNPRRRRIIPLCASRGFHVCSAVSSSALLSVPMIRNPHVSIWKLLLFA